MSGRRAHPRFREITPLGGQLRITSDVAVQIHERTTEIAVVSDAPAIKGEELTLALVSRSGRMEFLVKVAESRPQMIEGHMRHRVRLEILSVQPGSKPAEIAK